MCRVCWNVLFFRVRLLWCLVVKCCRGCLVGRLRVSVVLIRVCLLVECVRYLVLSILCLCCCVSMFSKGWVSMLISCVRLVLRCFVVILKK